MTELESLSGNGPANETNGLDNTYGRRTEIADYCEYRMKNSATKCILLCFKRGRRYYATDLEIDGSPFGVDDLRKHPVCGGWWKRYSLYSTIGVKPVLIRVVDCNFNASRPASTNIQVATTDFPCADKIARLDKSISKIDIEGQDSFDYTCGIDVNGRIHADKGYCENTAYDEFAGEEYCKVEYLQELCHRRDGYQFMPPFLESYWQHGVDAKGLAFLDKMSFVCSYDALRVDRYFDAANPYGKTINGFQLVEGWHTTYLLVLISGALLGGVCVTAVSAAVGQSFEAALTTGTYVWGLASALIAVFTLFSAIL